VGDLVLGPGQAGKTLQPEGLKAPLYDVRQRTMLLDVISEWAGIINDVYAVPRMAEINAGLAMHFHTVFRDPTNDYGHALTMQ
jgi:hypothetical protein